MNSIRLVFAADHAGYDLKNMLRDWAREEGYAAEDVGVHDGARADYPDYAQSAARMIAGGEVDFGIFVCGSGTGMTIAANKMPGIRAANAWLPEIARLARAHNNANVLCLPSRFMTAAEAMDTVRAFLSAEFEAGRHADRVAKLEG